MSDRRSHAALVLRLAAIAICANACGGPSPAGPATSRGSVAVTEVSSGCQSALSVGVVQVRAGCQIDERVSGQTAMLQHACGDGLASVAFADAVFEGTVRARELDVATETVFEFSDGCTWRTKQRIHGSLATGALAYRYEEQPDPGQRGCAVGCVADAQVTVR